jgi:hypothetical protein
MDKNGKLLAPILCAMIPLIPLMYLYPRNAEYISAVHVGLVGVGMAVVSLVGYMVLRLIAKSRLGALTGCLAAWIMFFALKSACDWIVNDQKLMGYGKFIVAYAGVTVILALAVAFALRKVRVQQLYPLLLVFFGVLLLFNAVPAVTTAVENEKQSSSMDLSKFKTQFTVSQDTPSPNVYWFHCDGMLGFDAYEKYFGDDQADFVKALQDRGFGIDRGATFEADHTTKIAVPALLCPYFYDSTMREVLKDHESAAKASQVLSKSELQYARVKDETRVAFEQKGYFSQTIGSINIYYPPVSDGFYVVGDSGGAYKLETGGDFEQQYLSIIEAGELAILLTDIPGNAYFNTVVKLGEKGLLGFPLSRSALTHKLTEEQLSQLAQGKKLLLKNRMMMEAINDSTYQQQPAFNFVFFIGAHYPFTVDENGEKLQGDPGDIHSYAGQHKYAATMLLGMIDEILARDPDAVIVLQADHGLHGQSADQITQAFGQDAVLPIWNQVMSALRVPDKYKNGDESYALESPLNMSRYLVNSFVGKNYDYLQ